MNQPTLLDETWVYGKDLGPVSLRCPGCRQIGVFVKAIAGETDGFSPSKGIGFGARICPNSACHALVLIVQEYDPDGNMIVIDQIVYPSEAIDFDSSDVPEPIVESFEEALRCHQIGAHTAAAIMIRRTLEELCRDREATGDTLKARIEALKEKLTIPRELLEAIDELRLLGNDAAHVDKKVFAEIGPEELVVALDFTKELLRSTYQYASVVARLKGLRPKTLDQ